MEDNLMAELRDMQCEAYMLGGTHAIEFMLKWLSRMAEHTGGTPIGAIAPVAVKMKQEFIDKLRLMMPGAEENKRVN